LKSIYSKAQNLEDVILWRALSSVKKGFYIDVGANEPNVDSVTKVFYESGWNGINIEPIEFFYNKLIKHRPLDQNLMVCASNTDNEKIPLLFVDNTGLSTYDLSVADKVGEMGFKAKVIDAQTMKLDTILSKKPPKDIHFLKIDVEGMEKYVLEGINFKLYRPWIVLIEAIKPLTNEPSHSAWHNILIESKYKFVYSDGINRFYLANEHLNLESHFNHPPNCQDQIFIETKNIRNNYPRVVLERDEFKTNVGDLKERLNITVDENSQLINKNIQKENIITAQQLKHDDLTIELNASRDELNASRDELNVLTSELSAIKNSRFWKITFPARATLDKLKKYLTKIKKIIKIIIIKCIKFSLKHERIKALLKAVTKLLGVNFILKNLYSQTLPQTPENNFKHIEENEIELSERELVIHKLITKKYKQNLINKEDSTR